MDDDRKIKQKLPDAAECRELVRDWELLFSTLLASPTARAFRSGEPHALLVPWTTMTLPEYWLLGAVAVLLYRVVVMLRPPRIWGTSEAQRNRMAFLRLWRWTVALESVQMAALYLDRIGLGVR